MRFILTAWSAASCASEYWRRRRRRLSARGAWRNPPNSVLSHERLPCVASWSACGVACVMMLWITYDWLVADFSRGALTVYSSVMTAGTVTQGSSRRTALIFSMGTTQITSTCGGWSAARLVLVVLPHVVHTCTTVAGSIASRRGARRRAVTTKCSKVIPAAATTTSRATGTSGGPRTHTPALFSRCVRTRRS